MTNPLALLSQAISGLVASARTCLCTVRTAADRHVTGVLMQDDAIVAVNQLLPPLEVYTAIFPSGTGVACRRITRDPVTDLAILRLDDPIETKPMAGVLPPVGSLAVTVATDKNGGPAARLSLIHRLVQTAHGLTPILDGGGIEPGAVVLDAEARLIGLAMPQSENEAMVIPAASIIRLVGGAESVAPAGVEPRFAQGSDTYGRPWLGVSLQPITVPDHLITKAGQPSGRMVVNVAQGGPADRAGLQSGDVLLTLNGNSTSGPNTLRAFLSSGKIGSSVEIKLMRDGVLMVTTLIVGAQPY